MARAEGPGPGTASADATRLAEEMGEVTGRLEVVDPDRDAPLADRLINLTAEALGVILLGAVALLTFANAASRYVLNAPLAWTEEVVFSIVPWLAMIGLFLSCRRGQMIRLDIYMQHLPAPLRRPVEALGQVFCVVIFGYVGWLGLEYVLLFGGDETPYLGYPRGLFTSALAVGSTLVAIAYAVELVRGRAAPRTRR
jgi:TRAP-type C4-dicarboxylate transport system permease small subunit